MSDHSPTVPPVNDATRLTPERIEQLRAQARQSGGLIDSRALHRVDRSAFYEEWATAVLGRDYPGVRWLHSWEITLLDLALDAEPDRPTPASVLALKEQARREMEDAQRARAEAYAAKESAWHALRDRLPVKVTVGHNWTSAHYEFYRGGRDHIVTQEDLAVGRVRRAKQQTLCETPSKMKSGKRGLGNPMRWVERGDDGEDRIPTCAPCLRMAERIADQENKAGS